MSPRSIASALPVLLAGTLGAIGQALPALSVGEERGEAGDTVHPVLRLRDPGVAVAFQCRIRVDPLAVQPGLPTWTPPQPELRWAGGLPAAGVLQLVVYSEELALLPGDLALPLPMRIASRTPAGRQPVVVEEVRFVSSAGSLLPAAPPAPGAIVVGSASSVPPVIATFAIDAAHRLRLDIRAPGQPRLIVESSDDLRDWASAGTITPDASGQAVFTSAPLPRPGHRFFRVLAPAP